MNYSSEIENNQNLTDSHFCLAFGRFCKAIEAESGEPFKDFGSGLPNSWEGYKEWVYHEARLKLRFDHWKKTDVGKGAILSATIDAIELHSSPVYRNNLVQWDARYGDQNRSHRMLLEALHYPETIKQIERTLYTLYRGTQEEEESVFSALVSELGKRYDLLAYLFFLKDWTRFMPVKPDRFSKAFELLGLSHPMKGKCSWENYQGYLYRLSLVRQKLSEFQVPGNRLIDAHSFCWILASLSDLKIRQLEPLWIDDTPSSVTPPEKAHHALESSIEKSADDYLSETQVKLEVGALAQSHVLQAEKQRLQKLGKKELVKKIKDVSANPLLGYDIESFQSDGSPKRIEVKAPSAGKNYWRFYISDNELNKSKELDGYVFALVDKVRTNRPRIWEFPGKELPDNALQAVTYQVYLKTPEVKKRT